MPSPSMRLWFAAASLIVLWVVIYWWTPAPQNEARVVFDALPDATDIGSAEAGEPLGLPPGVDPRAAGAASGPVRERSVLPPSFYRYVVQRGDTAQSISKHFYKTPKHWSRVMQANPKTDFEKLRPGLTILVPVDPLNIQGRVIEGEGSLGVAGMAPSGPGHEQVESAQGITYVVAPGDTLSELAQRFYGRSSDWPRILEANQAALGADGKKLRSGMSITIPPVVSPDPKGQTPAPALPAR